MVQAMQWIVEQVWLLLSLLVIPQCTSQYPGSTTAEVKSSVLGQDSKSDSVCNGASPSNFSGGCRHYW